jgi:uncharacterized protein involved in high-affinity Fe2+ transport
MGFAVGKYPRYIYIMYVVRTGGTETIPICQLSTDDYPVLGYNIQYNIYWGI